MKKIYLTIVAMVVIVSAAVFWRQEPSEIQPTFGSQVDDRGGVKINITPQNILEGEFKVVLDTHSVDLSEDLVKVTTLKDENGKEYKPISWDGSVPGGHHREGVLKFGSLLPKPQSVELIIRGIGGISERKFLWQL